MKRRISDLLDGIPAPDVELNHTPPLSSSRIKELTMSKIQNKNYKRIAFRVLVAAAIIAALGLSAVAAERIFGAGDLFRDILNQQLRDEKVYVEENELNMTVRETISEGQIEVVNKMGEGFTEQSDTDKGTTMTLTAAYADENVMHLYFKVVAPEGTVLPDDILYEFYDYNNDFDEDGHWYTLELAEDAPYEISGYFDEIQPLPDEDPTDNMKEFHVTIEGQSGQEMKFNDGVTKFYNITGIYEQVPDTDGDEDSFVQLAPGVFTFDIGLANEVEMVELDVAGLTYGGEKTRTWTHDSPCHELCAENLVEGEVDPEIGLPVHSESYTYSVTAKSLKLSPISADWECEWTCSDEQRSFGLDIQVVMKDGTSLVSYHGGGSLGDNRVKGTTIFVTPIDLDEVDYILIGDPEIGSSHKVYLP